MIASPKSPEPGILKTRVAIEIGDTHKSAALHALTSSYTAGAQVLPDSSEKFFSFQELLEFAYIFQCDGVAAGSVQDILGCSAKTAKDLHTEIARLEPWQVVARSQGKTEEFVKFEAEAF